MLKSFEPTKVVYHGGCVDGFFAALQLWLAYRSAEYVPANYGEPAVSVTPEDRLLLVDFSYPLEVLRDLQSRCQEIGVLDHHANVAEACRELEFFEFDANRSGATMVRAYLSQVDPSVLDGADCIRARDNLQWLVEYVEDRDLWRNSMYKSREINAAIRSYPYCFETWRILTESFARRELFQRLLDEGTGIVRYRDLLVEEHVRRASEIEIAGHRVLGVVCNVDITSEVAGRLAEGRPFGVTWFDKADTCTRVYSLRSRDDFDVSAVARQFGGNGHRRAAGFQVSFLSKLAPFDGSVDPRG